MVSGTRGGGQPEELLKPPINARLRHRNYNRSWVTHICLEPKSNIAEHPPHVHTHTECELTGRLGFIACRFLTKRLLFDLLEEICIF